MPRRSRVIPGFHGATTQILFQNLHPILVGRRASVRIRRPPRRRADLRDELRPRSRSSRRPIIGRLARRGLCQVTRAASVDGSRGSVRMNFKTRTASRLARSANSSASDAMYTAMHGSRHRFSLAILHIASRRRKILRSQLRRRIANASIDSQILKFSDSQIHVLLNIACSPIAPPMNPASAR
jgi:hypothetical protein